jgi:protein TonB
MIVAFTFNASILLALVLIPLIRPEALPHLGISILITAPAPVQQPRPEPVAETPRPPTDMPGGHIFAPSRIPHDPYPPAGPEPGPIADLGPLGPDPGVPGGTGPVLPGQFRPRVVRPEVRGPVPVSSRVEEVLLIRKTMPVYPPIGIAARAEGTVILEATISKAGTIENLRVVGGPPLLQRAALDAVSTWRYRPYVLDGQPVEVETTVNVVFTLSR